MKYKITKEGREYVKTWFDRFWGKSDAAEEEGRLLLIVDDLKYGTLTPQKLLNNLQDRGWRRSDVDFRDTLRGAFEAGYIEEAE